MLSKIFTISKLIKMFSSPFQMAIVKHIFGPNFFYSNYTWHDCLLTLGALCFTSLLTGKMVRRGSSSRLYRPVRLENIFVAFTLVGLILCLRSGNIHINPLMFFAAGDQLMLLACSCHLHWQMWAKHLIRPNPLKTYTNTNMNTNTDVSQTAHTSQPS